MYQIAILVHAHSWWFQILKGKAYFDTNRVTLLFFKILYCIFYSSYHIFIRQCFRSNWEVKALHKKMGLNIGWLSARHINNQFLFICYVSGALCYFVLAEQFFNFRYISLFFLNQKISYTNSDESFLQDGIPHVL